MPATVHSTVPLWRSPRAWPTTLTRAWRSSLRFRTLMVTVGLSALAITVACVWMALVIQQDLFSARRDQILHDAQRATLAAQRELNTAVAAGDPVLLQNLMSSVADTLATQSSSALIATHRIGPASALDPLPFSSDRIIDNLISSDLRAKIQTDTEDRQWYQSVAIPAEEEGTIPGIMVGQRLTVPELGEYELWLGYDLAAANQTLGFVQSTLWGVGIVLIVLIGAIAWFVLRSLTVPISQTAETSSQFAAGQLDVRLPVRGEDELATLGRSFNAMADSIESKIHELAELSLVQQRFVSDVSHELRTPLTTIRLAADMINDQRDSFEPTTARTAELLNTQVQRFETLLTDLLEISRYDAGSVQLEVEPTSLAQLAEYVIDSMQQLAEQAGTDLRLVAPGGHTPVDMDPRRVRRIVWNLLGNAIEHGEGRPIVVTVDSNQDAVALGVRDHGLGMKPEDVDRAFDRFWRADPSRKRTIGGTGLGLSIALGDARLHGGELTVWSRLGQGSHFVLTLPRNGAPLLSRPIPADPGAQSGEVLDSLGRTEPVLDLSAGRAGAKS